jgi:Flp pilus assembly CpaF family ATPase
MSAGYPYPAPPYTTGYTAAAYPAPPAPAPEPLNYALVKNLRGKVAEALGELERSRGGRAATRKEAETYVFDAVTSGHAGDMTRVESTVNAVLDLLFGAGRLQPLLDNDAIENVDINGRRVFVHYFDQDHPVELDPVTDSHEELIELVRTLASGIATGTASRPWDEANPELDFSLPGGLRFSGLLSVTGDGPAVSIRRNRLSRVFIKDLVANGTLTPECASFLSAAVAARKNLIIAGETNSGKTTLMRAMINAIEPHERLITIEKALELGVNAYPDLHPNAIALEVRLPNSEGLGEIGMRRLVRRSLRMNPSRVIVGEVLGDEIVEMLKAMTQGNKGSMSTLHADSAELVFERISIYARQGPEQLPADVVHEMISGAIDFAVYIRRARNAHGQFVRFVSEIREVNGYDGRVLSSRVFAPGPDGRAMPANAISCLDELIAHGYHDPAAGGWS